MGAASTNADAAPVAGGIENCGQYDCVNGPPDIETYAICKVCASATTRKQQSLLFSKSRVDFPLEYDRVFNLKDIQVDTPPDKAILIDDQVYNTPLLVHGFYSEQLFAEWQPSGKLHADSCIDGIVTACAVLEGRTAEQVNADLENNIIPHYIQYATVLVCYSLRDVLCDDAVNPVYCTNHWLWGIPGRNLLGRAWDVARNSRDF